MEALSRPAPPARFLFRFLAWSLGLFAVLRLGRVEEYVVWPLTRLQEALATSMVGAPKLPVAVTLECSGADTIVLCLGAILAYPARWADRFAGAAVGVLGILALNTIRVATLGAAAASPAWFNALHVYLWPAALTVAIATYVLTWARFVDRRAEPRGAGDPSVKMRRFVLLAAIFVLAFVLASPLYLESAVVLALASFVARAAAVVLNSVGVSTVVSGNVLVAGQAAVAVTQECITTPLIPVYLAFVGVFSRTWRWLIAGLLATVPLFLALGIVRLLLIALPSVTVSPLVMVHAFYQVVLGGIAVCAAARWRHGATGAGRRAFAGLLAAAAFVLAIGAAYTHAISAVVPMPIDDPQGAIAFFPSFQIGFYLGLWVASFMPAAWPRVLAGLAALVFSQVAVISILHAAAGTTWWNAEAHVRDVRAWAIAGPLIVLLATHGYLLRRAQSRA
jgi:exosortase/archaeosortase family protein